MQTKISKQFLLLITFLFCNTLHAQDTFYKAYGNTQTYSFNANAICNAFSNGYLVAGQRYTPTTGSSDVCVMSINDSGAVQWSKTYGGANDDVAWDIKQTKDGNYIVAGSTKSANGAFDMYVLKIDSAGSTLLSKTVGGGNLDIAYCITPTADSGFIVAGRTQSYGAGNEEFYLVKLNSQLAVQWSRTIGNTNPDYAHWAEELNDGSIITCGYTVLNGWDILLVKTDSAGNVLWKKNYGTASDNEYAYMVKPTPDGGFVMAGDQIVAAGNVRKSLITKVNSAGAVEWCKSFLASGFSQLSNVYVDSTGYVFTGYVVSNAQVDVLVIKTDFNGDTLFVKAIGSTTAFDYSEKTIVDVQGAIIIAGHTSYTGNYGTDFLLIKADSNANAGCYSSAVAVTVTNVQLTSATFGNNGSGANVVNFTTQELSAPESDTVFCSSILSSVQDVTLENTISVFPNPVTSELNVTLNEKYKVEYVLYNLHGEIVKAGNMEAQQKISMKDLYNGIYFLKLITPHYNVVKKVIKKGD